MKKNSWPEQAIFSVMRDLGRLNDTETYRTFNMGVGLIMILSSDQVDHAREILRELSQFKLYEVGHVVSGERKVKLI